MAVHRDRTLTFAEMVSIAHRNGVCLAFELVKRPGRPHVRHRDREIQNDLDSIALWFRAMDRWPGDCRRVLR